MSILHYKSEGAASGVFKSRIVLSIVFGIIGIFLFINGIQKRSALEYISNSFKSQQQQIFLILGVILVAAAILDIATAVSMNKSKILVYSDHIEGTSCSLNLPYIKNFNLQFNQISNVTYKNFAARRYVTITANGTKYVVQINGNVEEAYNAIKTAIGR